MYRQSSFKCSGLKQLKIINIIIKINYKFEKMLKFYI